MGRPINKRYLGAGTGSVDDGQFTAVVKVGTNLVSTEGVILRQRAETEFLVNDAADGTGNQGVCRLVDKEVPGDDEMVIRGFVQDTSEFVNIRKLHNRTVIDYDNNRYDWEIQDDSSTNVLVLTRKL